MKNLMENLTDSQLKLLILLRTFESEEKFKGVDLVAEFQKDFDALIEKGFISNVLVNENELDFKKKYIFNISAKGTDLVECWLKNN